MKKHIEKIKRHIVKRKHHYKVGLLFVVLLAIFFFAHKTGNSTQVESPLLENLGPRQYDCSSDEDCLASQFCELGFCSSEKGRCVDIPEMCPSLWQPVCGCDDKIYSNDCSRRVSKVSKKHDNSCNP